MVNLPTILGHRGAPADQPENSLAGFEHCLASGIAGVELDVQLSVDGEVVVVHDWTLERLYGRPESVAECSATELKNLGIPRLTELFSLAGSRFFYDIEIKQQEGDASPLVMAVLQAADEAGVTDSMMLSSFNPWAVRSAAQHAPDIPRACIFGQLPSLPRVIRRPWLDPFLGTEVLKPFWKDAHRYTRRKKPLLTWTVDDPLEAQQLLERGVAAIITNDPVRLRASL